MDEQPDQAGPDIRRALLGRDVACPHCSHNLRDCTAQVCPECGQTLTLFEIRHGQVMPESFLMRLCAFGMAVWITATVFGLMCAMFLLRTGSPERPPVLLILVGLLAWEVWITWRFTRRPRSVMAFDRAGRVFLWLALGGPVLIVVLGMLCIVALVIRDGWRLWGP